MLDLKTIEKLNDKKVGFFRFKKFDDDTYLLTNDIGKYVFLSEPDFKKFITGKITKKNKVYKDLKDNLFLIDNLDQYIEDNIVKYREKNSFLNFGPSLHIMVVTLRCNHNCIYCHASAGGSKAKGLDMNLKTAKQIVDLIFKSNNNALVIEFQGGEPLLNWSVVKFVVAYAREKNKLEKKDLQIRLVSNFSLLDDQKIEFLMDNEVNFCTSLDGDEETHNYNRGYSQGNSWQETVKWIKKINQTYQKKYKGKKKNYYRAGAVITISRKTLDRYKQIVDAYKDLGLRIIYLRYLNPYGFALKAKEKIWYTPEEYLKFYKNCLDYILDINYKSQLFIELTAVSYLIKILFNKDYNNLDMRSPCGAGIGQLAYNYNGDVYTCDEGRMISRMGDEMFKLGNIKENNLEQLINNNLCKSICLASCTNGQPGYEHNVYQPYLGICPVYNYSVYQNIFQAPQNNVKFQIDEAIIEYFFQKLKNKKNKDIFELWIKKAAPKSVLK